MECKNVLFLTKKINDDYYFPVQFNCLVQKTREIKIQLYSKILDKHISNVYLCYKLSMLIHD